MSTANYPSLAASSSCSEQVVAEVYADRDRQEPLTAQSELDWVLVRPAIFNNKPGNIRALTDLVGFHGGTISRRRGGLRYRAAVDFLGKRPLIAW